MAVAFFPQAPKSKEVIDKFWAYSAAKGWSEGQHTHPLSRPNSNTNRCHLRGISPASQEQQQLTLDAYYTALEEYKTTQAQASAEVSANLGNQADAPEEDEPAPPEPWP